MIIISDTTFPLDRIKKAWGEEIVLHNKEFCAKILRFKRGGKFSFHFHSKKEEVWLINKGKFKLTYIDTENAERSEVFLKEGNIVLVERNTPHQLEAYEDGEIFEASTPHYDDDSYRIEKGDSQK